MTDQYTARPTLNMGFEGTLVVWMVFSPDGKPILQCETEGMAKEECEKLNSEYFLTSPD
jgi:hypothetical protein